MARENKSKYSILGALSHKPMSGYDIKKWVAKVTGAFWNESPGQVYPMLRQLVREKLVTCDASQGVGKRPKKVYSLTQQGLTAFKTWLKIEANLTVMRDELTLKLFYGQHLSKQDYLNHLVNQKQRMQEKLIRFETIENHIKDYHIEEAGSTYWLMTLEGAKMHAKAEMDWCNTIIKDIKRKK